jgi:hypothetical protein
MNEEQREIAKSEKPYKIWMGGRKRKLSWNDLKTEMPKMKQEVICPKLIALFEKIKVR